MKPALPGADLTTQSTHSRHSWPLGRKLGLTAWFYILSILVNVAVSSACLLFYFEPTFRESRTVFQQQQQLEQLRSIVRRERVRAEDPAGPDRYVPDLTEGGNPISRAILGLRKTSVPQALGPAWAEIETITAQSTTGSQPADGVLGEQLATIESKITLAIEALGARRQDSITRAFQAQRWIIGLLVLNSLLGAVLCGAGLWFVREWVVQPARVLKEATSQIRGGNFNPRVALPFEDEMGMLGHEIGEMAQRIARLQEQLVDRERRAAAAEMVDRVEQRVREPLSRVRQLALASAQRNADQQEIAECQTGISATVSQFEQWLSQLRAGLACPAGKPGPVDVSTLFADVLAAVRPALKRHQVRLSIEATPDLKQVFLDKLQFEQALVSLVTNAIQASTAGQTVRLTGRPCEESADCWEVEVADEGSGIAPEVIDKIFLPFFTTKPDGTGLGLGQAKSVIELHGGQLLVRSMPGQGSVFSIRVPLHLPMTPALQHEQSAAHE